MRECRIETARIEFQRDELIEEIQKYESQINEMKNMYEVMKGESECQICFDAKINCALVTCGHMLCFTCAGEMIEKGCPFCVL